jgi:phenylalanyl-tRNA synthetase beta chain
VTLRYPRIEKLLGVVVPSERVAEILTLLGFGVHPSGDDEYEVTIPYWRDGDVQREADVIEEVGRIYGLDKIPATLPERAAAVGRLNPSQTLRRRLEDELRGRGFAEIVAWSFTAPSTFEKLRIADVPLLRVDNPLSEDQSVMRPLLLPGLLDAAARNVAHGRSALRLFESAHVYRAGEAQPDDEVHDTTVSPRGATPAHERHHIGVLLTQALPGTWRSPEKPADFYAAKGLLEALLAPAGVDWRVEPGDRPYLHPGRTATILTADERKLGWIGEIHPLVARAWDIPGAAAFEIDADLLVELDPGPSIYHNVTSFPAVRQDIAVVVASDVSAAEVESAVRAGGGDLLRAVRVFDLYEGDQVGEGKKSLALRLEFRADDRTLTDDDVAGLRSAIEAELDSIGGALRA